MGPRAPVQVVGADNQEDVVDDANFCVDVDRCSGGVLEVVHRDPVTTGAAKDVGGVLASDAARRAGGASAPVGVARNDCDDA